MSFTFARLILKGFVFNDRQQFLSKVQKFF